MNTALVALIEEVLRLVPTAWLSIRGLAQSAGVTPEQMDDFDRRFETIAPDPLANVTSKPPTPTPAPAPAGPPYETAFQLPIPDDATLKAAPYNFVVGDHVAVGKLATTDHQFIVVLAANGVNGQEWGFLRNIA
jgi:hypothetical protein